MSQDLHSRFHALAQRATSHAQPRNQQFLARMLAGRQRRQIETKPERGDVTFLVDRVPVLQAKYQIIGRMSIDERTWRWAWADPAIDAALAADARRVRDHGTQEGIPELTEPLLKSTEFDPAALTAIALMLAAAEAQWLWPAATGVFEFVALHAVAAVPQAVA